MRFVFKGEVKSPPDRRSTDCSNRESAGVLPRPSDDTRSSLAERAHQLVIGNCCGASRFNVPISSSSSFTSPVHPPGGETERLANFLSVTQLGSPQPLVTTANSRYSLAHMFPFRRGYAPHLYSNRSHPRCVVVLAASLLSLSLTSAWASAPWCELFPVRQTLADVTVGNGQFVAVGYGGAILSSTNGMDWMVRHAPQEDLSSVVFANDLFVAVGPNCGAERCSGTLLISSNGVDWTPIAHPEIWGLNAVTFGSGLFVAVGGSGAMISSTNGRDWVQRTSGTQHNLTGVKFGNGKFVAVGDGGVIITSPDGISWTPTESGTDFDFYGLTFGKDMFVVGSFYSRGDSRGVQDAILTSRDGLSWTKTWTAPSTDRFDQLIGATFANDTFVVVGYGENSEAGNTLLLLTSNNATNWTRRAVPSSGYTSYLSAAAYQNGTFVAVGTTGFIATSTNALDWIQQAPGDPFFPSGLKPNIPASGPRALFWRQRYQLPAPETGPSGIAFGNGRFASLTSGFSYTSTDGTNWESHPLPSSIAGLNSFTFANGLFIGVDSIGAVLSSPDGATWTLQRVVPMNLFGVGGANGLFVAVGGNGRIMTSQDAVTWSEQSSGVDVNLNSVAFGKGLFVVVGDFDVILTSPDAVKWTQRLPKTSGDLDKVIFGNGLFVATDLYGTIFSSSDGVSWEQHPRVGNTFYDVAYGNGTFVASGSGTPVYTSGDGRNWFAHQTGVPYVNRIAFGNETFVALGENGVILTSGNGDQWTIQKSGDAAMVNSISYGNGQFLATTDHGGILVSSNLVDWGTQKTATELSLSTSAVGESNFVAIAGWCYGCSSNDLRVVSSSGAAEWKVQPLTVPDTINRVTYIQGQYLALGEDPAAGDSTILSSPDGINWTRRYSGPGGGGALTSVAFGAGRYVAAGGSSYFATSADSVNWASCNPAAWVSINAVAYGSGKFVAAGGRRFFLLTESNVSEAALLTSEDGLNWNIVDAGLSSPILSLAYGEGQFVGICADGTLVLSEDGSTWFARTRPSDDEEGVNPSEWVIPQNVNYIGGSFVGWVGGTIYELDPLALLPAITSIAPSEDNLLLEWNKAAKGMTLQHTSTLNPAQWVNVPVAAGTRSATLHLGNSTEFFRLTQ
jgi:hypothetical protein